MATLRKTFRKRTVEDRSPPGTADASSSSHPPNIASVVLPPLKKTSLASVSQRSIDGRSPSSFSTPSVRDESGSAVVVGRQGPYPSMGPPSSYAPSVAPSTSSLHSSSSLYYADPDAHIRYLERQLRASQEDLLLTNNLARFQEEQYRQSLARHGQDLTYAYSRIDELERERSQRAAKGSGSRRKD